MIDRYSLRKAAAVALALVLVAGCAAEPEEGNASDTVANVRLTKAQLSRVTLYTVVPLGYQQRIEAPGTVDFDNDQATAVVSPFSGPVTRTLVSLGQHVVKGQPLALVQSADFAAAIGTYRKTVAAANTARRVAAVDRDLLANNGIAAREAAQAQTDAASADADRDAALQSLLALNVDRGTINAIMAGRTAPNVGGIIRAPVSGTIVDKQVTPGQLLQAGTSPTFTVADLSQVWVLVQVAGSDLNAIRVNDGAEIDPGTNTGLFHGTVENIGASVDPSTRAVVARVVVPNPGGLLKKQMYVNVSIQSGQVSTGLLVPVSAVLRDDQNLPFVYLAQRDGSFARRHVTLGYHDAQHYDVTSGLQNGDRVVVDGAIFLQFMQSQ
ncbi:efflux RND transporter periplasmic adaptor subunit [Sphingomonas bacterium]|uniref:efflux RND transporter periplasmic adaptor subunit n=1 Tax=Sphingomonas bacterium TaxID=1895847 RepID=UPI002628B428|nr:efflux RND transporter periplasmic adaptor subunit [Sphingomonas bacterium]MDB5679341.1 family efflux transporter, subunit [Sphingomonas bacterium]